MEVHQSQERIALRDRSDWVFDEHAREPDGFVTQLAANQTVGLRGAVAFAEEQIQHLEDARNALFQLHERGHVEIGATFTQPMASALQTLVNRIRVLKETQSDLFRAEPAQRLQSESELRHVGDLWIGAQEEHSQEIIRKLGKFFSLSPPGNSAPSIRTCR